MVFLLGSTLLLTMSVIYYFSSRNSAIEQARSSYIEMAVDRAHSMDLFLMGKEQITGTIANAPILAHTLIQSNSNYAELGDSARQERIKDLNGEWRAALSINDPIIQRALSNPAAEYLRKQQTAFPGEYGEIFVTNRYGALVASTGKLTTFAHANKYWWKASYHEGEGKIFFDDRGFDQSVEGYVLGVVVPIRQGTEIIGILKCNLNVTDALSDIIMPHTHRGEAKALKLVRTGGLIVLEEGKEPLSTRVSSVLADAMKDRSPGSLILQGDHSAQFLAYAPVDLTHGSEEYGFGGSTKSVDHSKGNEGEGWFIVSLQPLRLLYDATKRTTQILVGAGIFFCIVTALGAWLLSRTLARPILKLVEHSQRVGRGDFDAEVNIVSNDELGILARSFNTMANDLRETMVSRYLLVEEVDQRKQTEDALRGSEERYRSLFENMLNGFALHKIVLDEKGIPVDYIYLDVNDAFEEVTSLKRENLIGKRVTEALPGIENDPADWIGMYGKVSLGGEEIRFENYSEPLNKWFSIYVYRPFENHFVTIVEDITDRKQAEEALQKARDEVQALQGILPICSSCKKIRDDKGHWNQVDVYVRDHSEADFSHGICPECAKRLYPDIDLGDEGKPEK